METPYYLLGVIVEHILSHPDLFESRCGLNSDGVDPAQPDICFDYYCICLVL